MDDGVAAQLRACGWWPERRVDVTLEVSSLEQAGVEIWPELLDFLMQYARLEIKSNDGTRSLSLDPSRAVAGTDLGWGRSYSSMIGTALAPVGEYSHMTIYLGRDGEFYGGFDAEYGRISANVEGLIDSVLNRHPAVRLDQVLS